MKINKNSLQAKVQNKSKELDVDLNILYTAYYFDCLLTRLAASKYSDNFIFKGGFLLSSIFGIDARYTMDIDFSFRREELIKDNIVRIFNEIINIDVDDLVSFEFLDIRTIREEDEYGGFAVRLNAKLENMRQIINVDITTGDPITPCEISYKHKCLFSNEELLFKSYNLETIISEKFQTIISKSTTSSRYKDLYDIYIIYKLSFNKINKIDLRLAFDKTCKYRQTEFTREEIAGVIKNISESERMKNDWKRYSTNNKFAKNINFDEIIVILYIVTGFIKSKKE